MADSSGATKVVAIIGASADRKKFGNKAVRAYRARGWKVYPIHPTAQQIEGLPAYRSMLDVEQHVDRVSLYLPPAVGVTVLDEIARKGVDEFFVNPGAESDELIQRARFLGLHPICACSIVNIGMSPEALSEG
jgi:uncharacterized protein